MEEQIRLQKYLASCGIASRRKCEELIVQGRIKINGHAVTELGTKINPNKDKVEYNGKLVKQSESHIYILLNKPIDYVTTARDQFGRNRGFRFSKGKQKNSSSRKAGHVYIGSTNINR